MVDEIFKKNIFQLARILIFLGKSHFPSVIGWGAEIHLKHIKNRIKVNKILPLEWQSRVLNYKILCLLLTSWKPLPNLKYIFHLCHKFCHAFDHNSFSQDKMFQKWGTQSIKRLVLLVLNFSKYHFRTACLYSFRRCSGFQSTQLLLIPGFPSCDARLWQLRPWTAGPDSERLLVLCTVCFLGRGSLHMLTGTRCCWSLRLNVPLSKATNVI